MTFSKWRQVRERAEKRETQREWETNQNIQVHIRTNAQAARTHTFTPTHPPGFEVLDGADALEGAVDHDSDAGAERLTLFHAVRREHDGAAVPHDALDAVPEEAARTRVHARRRLVLHNGRSDSALFRVLLLLSNSGLQHLLFGWSTSVVQLISTEESKV